MPSPERPDGRAVVSWSGGKDSAWALEQVRKEFQIVALITTVEERTGRIPVHNVPGELLDRQAESLDIPLWTVPLPWPCSNAEYRERLQPVYVRAGDAGARTIVFGDLFLTDIRAFRERSLQGTGLTPVFPLWERPTAKLARDMLSAGLRATITSVDLDRLPAAYAGRPFDPLNLPGSVDPCGENGEFHTFVTNGPMFRSRIAVTVGSIRQDGRFACVELAYIDSCPASSL